MRWLFFDTRDTPKGLWVKSGSAGCGSDNG